jgi:hypothetical protein
MKILLVLAVAAAVGGCSLVPKPGLDVVDTFCLTSKKRQWSINDSVESIHQAEVWNATIDRRCGVKKPTA